MKRLAAMLAILLSGCGKNKPGDIPKIHYGVDTCARCGMVISEERFAAGYVDARGRSIVFDDVGEFLLAIRLQPTLASSSYYVHDAQDGRWLRASEAFFVHIVGMATPMGTGFAAFAAGDEAEPFRKRFGSEAPSKKLTEILSAP